jgi:hypothetical protein
MSSTAKNHSSSRNSQSRKTHSSSSNEENEKKVFVSREKPKHRSLYLGMFSALIKPEHSKPRGHQKNEAYKVCPRGGKKPGGSKRRRTKKRKTYKQK